MSLKVKKFWSKYGAGYLFLFPFLVLFALFTIIPVVVAFSLSFTNYNMLQDANFVGLTNYRLLILEDDLFILALKNTFTFAIIQAPISFFASFFFAWIINQLKHKTFFSLAFYVPSLCSGVAMSNIWLYFFGNDRMGLINNLLLTWGFINEPILWTVNPELIMPVVILVSVWMSMGSGFLSFLAGLQNLSAEVREAAKIDGIRNSFQELVYIILPQLKPQLLYGSINSVVAAFGVFDIITAMVGMPSPDYAAHTLVAHLYDYAFIRFEMGYASVISVFLFLITFVIGQLLMKFLSTRDREKVKIRRL